MILAELIKNWPSQEQFVGPPKGAIKLWNDEGRTIFIDDGWGPPVPYPAVTHENGEQNHGYVQVKSNLGAIATIPEVDGWPELREFLESINASSSPIESLGCEKGFFPVEGKNKVTTRLGSYVDAAFSNAALNEAPENLLGLAAELIAPVEGCHDWWTVVEIGLQRLKYFQGVARPWGLVIRVNSYGRGEAEARKLWARTLILLGGRIKLLPADFASTS